MVSQTARRRINTISGHFGADLLTEDLTVSTTNLFPLNCSSNLSTPFRRLDNRLHYGRQASAAQGFFMKQAETPINQTNCTSNLSTPFKRLDNRMHYGRQSSASQGYFMRQAASPVNQTGNSNQTDVCGKSCINEEKPTFNPTPPLFNRMGSGEPQFAKPEVELNWFAKMPSASSCRKFARPTEQLAEKKLTTQKPIVSSQPNEWSPRINVAESKCSYVITVELPGIDVRDIRVEMDDKNLIVRGKRSAKWWNATGCSNDSDMTYHKREISQGQYQVIWPIPAGANKDYISAEFMEGILQITIPKM
ncbi:uncharacterized protein LOC141616823 isoform X2 [Silene latifolia]|uniref:uncharacterized protein LOC141616823 isoform X2 n=1 Tax=Silene latifolia TaxID=37657 RepID=UPI003D782C3A